MDIDSLIKLVGANGALCVMLIVALRWADAERRRERDARIAALEESSKLCMQDRIGLRAAHDDLQKEVRALMLQIIADKSKALAEHPAERPAEHPAA